MAIEIERKFLTLNDDWKQSSHHSSRLRQGYLSSEKNCSVRIRTSENQAWINVKSITIGTQRQEYEYEIPLADGNEMLDTLSRKPLIEKTRYLVKVGQHIWEVDVFESDNAGLTVAEIELDAVDEAFEKPSWAGKEVTDDARYYNTRLSKLSYTQW